MAQVQPQPRPRDQRRSFPLATKMVLLSVGISGALAASLTWFGYNRAASGLRAKSELALGSESLLTAMTIDNWKAERLVTLRGVASLRSVRTVLETAVSLARDDVDASNLALSDIASVAPEIESIEVIDLQGGIIASTTDEVQPKGLLQRPEMRSALDGREYVSGISVSPSTGTPCLYSSVPARGSNGTVVGVVRARQSLERVQALVAGAKARMGELAEGVLLDRDGLVVSTTVDGAWRGRPVSALTPEREKEMLAEGRWGEGLIPAHLNATDLAANREVIARKVFSWNVSGTKHVAVAEPISHAGWTYAAALPLSQVESEARGFLLRALAGALLGLIAAFVLAQVVARRIVRSIHHLIDVSRRVVTENDLTQRIELASNDEVGILGEAFREMMVKLRERSSQLGEAKDQAESASRAKSSFLRRRAGCCRGPRPLRCPADGSDRTL
jgi:HAMP domain-containing protein